MLEEDLPYAGVICRDAAILNVLRNEHDLRLHGSHSCRHRLDVFRKAVPSGQIDETAAGLPAEARLTVEEKSWNHEKGSFPEAED
ncbi:MAG: hypothetical protein LBJ64_07340 [Deltaproteobacteria bacterium]|nr:hypothetical protein [Deltaproteobacteria bacterium]